MARARNTGSPSTPKSKRQSGYVVTIKGFVPNGTSFAEQRTTIDAMEAAQNGDASAALALMTGTEITSKLTTRVISSSSSSATSDAAAD